MIEVVFSQSAYGSLKMAQREAITQPLFKRENAFLLSGNPADVFCIDVAWSIGDISDSDIGDGRWKALEQAAFICPHNRIENSIHSAQFALHTVLDRAACGEAVRIWYSHIPDEMCGFCWLLSKIKAAAISAPIYAVKLPEWEYSNEKTLCTYVGWGEIEPKAWGRYISLQQQVKQPFLTTFPAQARDLNRE